MPTIGDWLSSAQAKLNTSNFFEDDVQLTLKFLIEARTQRYRPFISDETLTTQEQQRLDEDLFALTQGKPLPYVIGEWSFYGYDFLLTPDVLIPRPETELLVEEALNWLETNRFDHPPRVYDIGTGSGVIAITIAKRYSKCSVLASDISPGAIAVCEQNIHKHNIDNRVSAILTKNIPEGEEEIDLLCANLPYIPERLVGDLQVSKFEPRLALDGGPDGLRIIEDVLKQSVSRMNATSLLLFEIEASQKQSALLLTEKIYPHSKISVLKDLAGKDRLLRIENK